jgi:predicted amidohydrolase YtcJ
MVSRVARLLALVAWTGCANGPSPAVIIIHAKVFTSNPAQPWAEAVAVRGDRIIAVGDTAAIAALAGSSTRRLDAGGRTIIPGINDAHQHVSIAPPHDRLSLPMDPTIDQIAEALRAQIKTTPADRLITGDFGEIAWGNPSFTRAWLDEVAPESRGDADCLHRARHAAE